MNDRLRTASIIINTFSPLSILIVVMTTIERLFIVVPIVHILGIIVTLNYLKSLDGKNLTGGATARDICTVANLLALLFVVIIAITMAGSALLPGSSGGAAGFLFFFVLLFFGPFLNIVNIIAVLRTENNIPGEHIPWKAKED